MSSQLEKLEMSTEGGQKSARALNWLRLGLPKIKENFSVLQGGGGGSAPLLGSIITFGEAVEKIDFLFRRCCAICTIAMAMQFKFKCA